MKKEYMSPELELLDLKSPVIMDTVNVGGEGYEETIKSVEDPGFDEDI